MMRLLRRCAARKDEFSGVVCIICAAIFAVGFWLAWIAER